MPALILAILAMPEVRSFVEEIALKLIADILHRRQTDPEFLAKSDAIFAGLGTAKTEEEKANALRSIQTFLVGH